MRCPCPRWRANWRSSGCSPCQRPGAASSSDGAQAHARFGQRPTFAGGRFPRRPAAKHEGGCGCQRRRVSAVRIRAAPRCVFQIPGPAAQRPYCLAPQGRGRTREARPVRGAAAGESAPAPHPRPLPAARGEGIGGGPGAPFLRCTNLEPAQPIWYIFGYATLGGRSNLAGTPRTYYPFPRGFA